MIDNKVTCAMILQNYASHLPFDPLGHSFLYSGRQPSAALSLLETWENWPTLIGNNCHDQHVNGNTQWLMVTISSYDYNVAFRPNIQSQKMFIGTSFSPTHLTNWVQLRSWSGLVSHITTVMASASTFMAGSPILVKFHAQASRVEGIPTTFNVYAVRFAVLFLVSW